MANWVHDTFEKLDAAGYKFQNVSKCLAPTCEKRIHWFITPKGHYMPFEKTGEGIYSPHFSTCVEARQFSRRGNEEVVRR